MFCIYLYASKYDDILLSFTLFSRLKYDLNFTFSTLVLSFYIQVVFLALYSSEYQCISRKEFNSVSN